MPLFEDRSAAFIVRVWCESGGELPGAVRAWRGSIEHVPTGERAFFTELDAVIAFMRPHLVTLGIEEPSRFWERMDDLAASPVQPQALLPPYPEAAGAPPAPARKARRHGH
jgi:hypothetical protein